MTYAITQTCCSDATCVAVCPVNCIHPTPEERAFGSTEMLHIDPKTCIDCGACADACPVDAIFPVSRLPEGQQHYAALNANWYGGADTPQPPEGSPLFHDWNAPGYHRSLPSDFGPLRVAVVGTGPAGMYAAEDLLLHTNAQVTLVDRLPVAGGLVRYGVAPDHQGTKKVGEVLGRFHRHPRVRLVLGAEVGKDLSAEELAAHHDAVIYAVGAAGDRQLGVPGEELPGSLSATSFVAWYNAHPEIAADAVQVRGPRAAIVGNGNVALDAARILVADPDRLAATDIADHALAALREAAVREVVLLGRRGPAEAAYTRSELLALRTLDGVELVIDDHDPRIGETIDAAEAGSKAAVLQGVRRERIDWTSQPPATGARRIVLRFHSAPAELLAGSPADGAAQRVRAVRATGADSGAEIPAGTVLRAIGYRGRPVPGLPFDEDTGTVPHQGGRVQGRPGTYVVGWIKRGSTGGIGANRTCAEETVGTLLADAVAGELPAASGSPKEFERLARRRVRRIVDARGLAAINRAETARGAAAGRPRVKLTTVPELLATARKRR